MHSTGANALKPSTHRVRCSGTIRETSWASKARYGENHMSVERLSLSYPGPVLPCLHETYVHGKFHACEFET